MKEPFQFTFGNIVITVSPFSKTMLEMSVRTPDRSYRKYIEPERVAEEVSNVIF